MKASPASPFGTVARLYRLLPGTLRLRVWRLVPVMVFMAGLDLFMVASVGLFAAAASSPESLLATGPFRLLDRFAPGLLSGSTHSLMLAVSALAFGATLVRNAFFLLSSWLCARLGADAERALGERLFALYLRAPYTWHMRRNSSDLTTTMYNRVNVATYLNTSLMLVQDLAAISFMAATLFVMQPVMTPLLGLGAGVLALAVYKATRGLVDANSRRYCEQLYAINECVTRSLHGIKDVRISASESRFMAEFSRHATVSAACSAAMQYLPRIPTRFLETAGVFLVCLATWGLMFWQGLGPAALTGTLALLAVAAWRILPATNRILDWSMVLRQGMPLVDGFLSEIEALEKLDGLAPDLPGPMVRLPLRNELRFENVRFRYAPDGPDALDAVSFAVRKGEAVGIVGTSGAGKSTVADLCIGLLTPFDGSVCVDGAPLTDELRPRWSASVGYVSQNPYLANDTLAGNIAFGQAPEEIDIVRVRECCRMAAMDFLDTLPDGLSTMLGERGVRLSGGQRQRVAIARALYRQPDILLFDEATSALDTASERAIQDTILGFKGSQTMLVIAHRLSTVEECDRVLWLEKGRVRAFGPTAEVLPAYRDRLEALGPDETGSGL